MKARIVAIFIGLCLLWTALILRAGYLQFLPNEKLKALQNRQFKTVVTLQARRGAILDRNGRDLALSTSAFSLYADPKLLENKRSLARRLAKELGVSQESIMGKIRDSSKRFVWIQRMMEPDKADRIKEWGERGLSFVEEWRRVYPNESILAHTLGFLGIDGQALEGLELQYDPQLRGANKKMSVRRDARGRPLVADGLLFTENPDGNEIKLTIDSELQYNLESELHAAINEFDADSAVGIVLDAETSAVRAMASIPTFDANHALGTKAEVRRNRAITDAYEPGSTMKTFVLATALHENKLKPNTKFFCENGQYKVADRIIREADSKHSFGWLTATEVLAYSSNIGTTKIAFQLGEDKVREGLVNFGFGSKLGVDLPGEVRGTLHPLPWRSHLLSNVSFGQGFSATPLQIANAYAAVANGGILNSPYIVQSVRDVETGEVIETKPKKIRQVLTAEESASMRLMLTAVTASGGTGVNANVNGFIVGGKTGTAQKFNPNGRGYLKNAYISSFGGFIPAHDPKFVIYVAVDHPKKAYYGSQVAAPIFSKIASYAVRQEGLAPQLLTEKVRVPKKKERMPTSVVAGSTNRNKVATAAEILHSVEPTGIEVVPDFSALSLREVLRRASGKDINIKVIGHGIVSEVIPAPGEPLPDDKQITVILK